MKLRNRDFAEAIEFANNNRCALGCCKATVSQLRGLERRGQLAGKFDKAHKFDIRTVSNNPHEQFTLRGHGSE